MKPKLTTVALVVGVLLALGPWVIQSEPSKNWYWVTALGVGIASIAGYNSQGKMLGMGEPGEKLLQAAWLSFRRKVLRIGGDRSAEDEE